MSPFAALLLAAATAPQGAPPADATQAAGSGAQVATAQASARIVRGARIRRDENDLPEGPRVQINRERDGRMTVEFL